MIAKVDPIGYVRFGLRVFALLLVLMLCVPCYYLWWILRLPQPWPRWFLASAGWICGVRRRTIGTPLRRDVFFISNHLSWIDIPVIAGACGSAFVAKHELRRAPLIGWLCTLNKTVFVSRSDRMGVAEQINHLREALAETWAITVFPEGTTTDGHSLLPFKPALMAVLEPPPPGVLVQPVMLDFHATGPDIAWIGVETGQHNAFRVLARRGSFPVTVHFLDPFDPHDFPGRKAIAAESRRRIETALVETLGCPLRPFSHDEVAAARMAA